MKEPLKVTPELLELPFNDNIRYEVGDDVANLTSPAPPADEVHRILEELYKQAPEMEIKESYFKKDDLKNYRNIVENVTVNLTEDLLKQFPNIYVKRSEDSEEEALQQAQDNYDGVSYYANNDYLWLPLGIKHYIEDHGSMEVQIAVYNYSERINHNTPIEGLCQEITAEKIPDFLYIPAGIKYKVFKETKVYNYNSDLGPWQCLYINVPFDYYSKHIAVDCRTLAYNITHHCWIGHSNDNFTKMNHLCCSIANNGLPIPVAAELMGNGNFALHASNKKQMMAQYLGSPYIPMIIIAGPIAVERGLLRQPEPDVESANLLLNPYFLVI